MSTQDVMRIEYISRLFNLNFCTALGRQRASLVHNSQSVIKFAAVHSLHTFTIPTDVKIKPFNPISTGTMRICTPLQF